MVHITSDAPLVLLTLSAAYRLSLGRHLSITTDADYRCLLKAFVSR